MNKQQGGTLLGLIIGALLGLGIALAVAVYVTKVPVPFMNKGLPRGSDNDAAEAKKNRDWNPNAPLAGKNPAKAAPSASGELAKEPEPPFATTVPDPTPAPGAAAAPDRSGKQPERVVKTPKPAASATPAIATATAPAPAAVIAKPARPAPAEDPLGDLAKSRSQPESGNASGGADPFNYFIQAGAFRTPEDAEQQRARLLLLGMQARVTEREQAGRTVYRVRVGPFDKKDDADKVKDRLDNNSVETALVRVQR